MTATPTAPREVVDRDYPLAPVPLSERRHPASVIVIVVGFLFFTPTMFTAGQVSVAFPFAQFVVLAAVAAGVLAVYIALMGAVSARTGLTTVLVSRLVFGRIGGKWASLVLGGTQVGWFGITLTTIAELVGRATGMEATWPIVVLGGVLTSLSAYFGVKGIEILSWISVPLMLVLCFWVLGITLDEVGGAEGLLAIPGAGGLSAGTAITLMIGTFISGGTQIGNWTRFARTGRVAFIATIVAVLLAQFMMLFFGGVGAAAFGQGDFAELLVLIGLIVPGVVLMIANLWTTNDNAAYAFGVAGSELFGKPDKRPFVVGGTIVGIVIAVSGLGSMLVPFLTLLGVVIPPLGGAVIGMFFLAWRGRAPRLAHGEEPLVRVSGLVAYGAGIAAAAIGTAFDLGSPAVQGVLVAMLVAPLAAAVERTVLARR